MADRKRSSDDGMLRPANAQEPTRPNAAATQSLRWAWLRNREGQLAAAVRRILRVEITSHGHLDNTLA